MERCQASVTVTDNGYADLIMIGIGLGHALSGSATEFSSADDRIRRPESSHKYRTLAAHLAELEVAKRGQGFGDNRPRRN
jgi:hypothetical protein